MRNTAFDQIKKYFWKKPQGLIIAALGGFLFSLRLAVNIFLVFLFTFT